MTLLNYFLWANIALCYFLFSEILICFLEAKKNAVKFRPTKRGHINVELMYFTKAEELYPYLENV